MEAIKGYVMCALIASVISGILKNLSSEMRSFDKYITFVSSLVVIIMLATPFVSIAFEVDKSLDGNYFSPNEEENDKDTEDSELYDKTLTQYYAKAVENSVSSILSSKFSLDNEDFKVKATLEKDKSGNLTIKEVIIFLYDDINIDEIEYYTEKILCLKTEIRRSEKQ